MKTSITLPVDFLASAGSLLKPLTRNKVKPILENIRLDARGGEVRLCATNLTSAATIEAPCEFTGDLSALLPADRLFGFAALAKDGTLSIGFNGESKAEIRSASSKLSLPTADPKEYPTLLLTDGESHIMPCAAIKSACRVSFACSEDDARYALAGPAITMHEGWAHLSATDGNRGASHKLAPIANAKFEAVPLPYESFGLLSRLPDSGDCTVTIGLNSVSFAAKGISLTIRRVEGRFPRLDQVIKGSGGIKATINPATLLPIISPSLLLYEEENKGCELMFSPEEIRVRKSGTLGEADAAIAAVCGGSASSTFDSKYLRDLLASFPEGASAAAQMKGDEALFLETDNYQTVLMPFARK